MESAPSANSGAALEDSKNPRSHLHICPVRYACTLHYRFQTDYRQNCGFAVSPIIRPLIKRRVNMPTRRLALNSLMLLRVGSFTAGIFSSIICMVITDFFFYIVLFGCTLPKQSIHNKDYVCFNNYLSNHVPLISIVITFVS